MSASWLQHIRTAFLDLIFPPRCQGCKTLGAWYCAECIQNLVYVQPPFCARCGQELRQMRECAACRRHPLTDALDGLRAVAHHDGTLRRAIHALKYERLSAVAQPLGDLLAAYLAQHPLPCTLIIPVPLHAERQAERGYNQSALLAAVVAQRSHKPVNTRALVRHRYTRAQVGLNESERRQNLIEAFRCEARLEGEQVLLLDDVCTTGSTLSECAQVLRGAGARTIWGLTLAR